MEKLEYISDLPDEELKKEWVIVLFDVITKLPVHVQTKLRNEVTVFFAYNKTGKYMESRKKLIYLNCFQMEIVKMPIWAKRYIVIHEFAHAYSRSCDEKVVISLMKEWGFNYYKRYCKRINILQIN
jgi:hypothetical protein